VSTCKNSRIWSHLSDYWFLIVVVILPDLSSCTDESLLEQMLAAFKGPYQREDLKLRILCTLTNFTDCETSEVGGGMVA
jgi:hypothetical protein